MKNLGSLLAGLAAGLTLGTVGTAVAVTSGPVHLDGPVWNHSPKSPIVSVDRSSSDVCLIRKNGHAATCLPRQQEWKRMCEQWPDGTHVNARARCLAGGHANYWWASEVARMLQAEGD